MTCSRVESSWVESSYTSSLPACSVSIYSSTALCALLSCGVCHFCKCFVCMQIVRSLVHSLVHSLIHSFSHSLQSVSQSFNALVMHSLSQSVVSFIHFPGSLKWRCGHSSGCAHLSGGPTKHGAPLAATLAATWLNWPQSSFHLNLNSSLNLIFIYSCTSCLALFVSDLPCEYLYYALECWGRLQVASKSKEESCFIPYILLEIEPYTVKLY